MRKVAVFGGAVLGMGAALLAPITDGIGLMIVMMSIGAVAGAAIGGTLSRLGKRTALQRDSIPEIGLSPDDRMTTYWRDKGEIYPMPGHPDPEGARRELPNYRNPLATDPCATPAVCLSSGAIDPAEHRAQQVSHRPSIGRTSSVEISSPATCRLGRRAGDYRITTPFGRHR